MLTTPAPSFTAGALSPDGLTGSLVRLWPYAPGVYGRDALYRVWKAMEDDGATKQAFWDDTHPETGADLVSFVKLFSGTDRVLLMIERLDTGKLCGCFWGGQVAIGHQAFVGMWRCKEARGACSVDAARVALRYTFQVGAFQQLWALTPWRVAGVLCRKMGFEPSGILQKFCQDGPYGRDVTIYHLAQEVFYGLNLS